MQANDSINKIIAAHLTGKATAEQEKQLRAWLAESKDNEARFTAFASSKELAGRLRRSDAIDTEKAWRKFSHDHLRGKVVSLWRRVLPYAATVAMLVAAGAALWFRPARRIVNKPLQLPQSVVQTIAKAEKSGHIKATVSYGGQAVGETVITYDEALAQAVPDESHAADTATMKTPGDSEFWLTLSDGSRIHLSNNTTFIYPVQFRGDTRTVWLDGEAYFFVRHDDSCPFMVRTRQGLVRDYGTEFFVSTTTEPGKTQVILAEGSVSVTPANGKESMLRPGNMAVVDTRTASVSNADIEAIRSWNTGNFVFTDCRLDKLVQVLGLWYGKTVVINNGVDRSLRFTGIIDKYDDITPAIEAIGTITGLHIRQTATTIIVSK